MDHETKMIDLGDAKIETKGPPAGDKQDLIGPSREGNTGLTNE
jgi:hypothetical protein